jgi:hypothetical protein
MVHVVQPVRSAPVGVYIRARLAGQVLRVLPPASDRFTNMTAHSMQERARACTMRAPESCCAPGHTLFESSRMPGTAEQQA